VKITNQDKKGKSSIFLHNVMSLSIGHSNNSIIIIIIIMMMMRRRRRRRSRRRSRRKRRRTTTFISWNVQDSFTNKLWQQKCYLLL
jgi:hypothetical protein